jgi:hypothetical protein
MPYYPGTGAFWRRPSCCPSRLCVTLALVVRRNLGPATLRVWLAVERHFQDKCAPILAVFLGR